MTRARVEEDRTPRAVASLFETDSTIRGAITWSRMPRLKMDARCQTNLAWTIGDVCLDISFHRRSPHAPSSCSRPRGRHGVAAPDLRAMGVLATLLKLPHRHGIVLRWRARDLAVVTVDGTDQGGTFALGGPTLAPCHAAGTVFVSPGGISFA